MQAHRVHSGAVRQEPCAQSCIPATQSAHSAAYPASAAATSSQTPLTGFLGAGTADTMSCETLPETANSSCRPQCGSAAHSAYASIQHPSWHLSAHHCKAADTPCPAAPIKRAFLAKSTQTQQIACCRHFLDSSCACGQKRTPNRVSNKVASQVVPSSPQAKTRQ